MVETDEPEYQSGDQQSDPRKRTEFVSDSSKDKSPIWGIGDRLSNIWDDLKETYEKGKFRNAVLANPLAWTTATVGFALRPGILWGVAGAVLNVLKQNNLDEEISDNPVLDVLTTIATAELGAFAKYSQMGNLVPETSLVTGKTKHAVDSGLLELLTNDGILTTSQFEKFKGATPEQRATARTVVNDGIVTHYSGKPAGIFSGNQQLKFVNGYLTNRVIPEIPIQNEPKVDIEIRDGEETIANTKKNYDNPHVSDKIGQKAEPAVLRHNKLHAHKQAVLNLPAGGYNKVANFLEDLITARANQVVPSHSPLKNVFNGLEASMGTFTKKTLNDSLTALKRVGYAFPADLKDISLGTLSKLTPAAKASANAFVGVLRGMRQMARSVGPGIVFESMGTLLGNGTLKFLTSIGGLDWIGPREDVERHVDDFISAPEGSWIPWNVDPLTSYWRAGNAVTDLAASNIAAGKHEDTPQAYGDFVEEAFSDVEYDSGDTFIDNYFIEPTVEGFADATGLLGGVLVQEVVGTKEAIDNSLDTPEQIVDLATSEEERSGWVGRRFQDLNRFNRWLRG